MSRLRTSLSVGPIVQALDPLPNCSFSPLSISLSSSSTEMISITIISNFGK